MRIIYTGAYKCNLYPFVHELLVAAHKEGISVVDVKNHVKESIKRIESLGIAVGGLSQAELSQIQVGKVENINTYIDMMFVPAVKSGSKGTFSKIALMKDGKRWKCQPVLKDYNGVGQRYQKTGITPAVVEKKILNLIYEVMKENLSKVSTPEEQNRILLQTKDEAERYATVVHTKQGMANVCEFLDRLKKMIT